MICVCESCNIEFKRRRGTRGRFCSRRCWGTHMSKENPKKLSVPADFWSRVKIGGGNECWEWLGYRGREGYGYLIYQNRSWLAHRLAFVLDRGIDPGCVCHYCDNPPCCNPYHLFPGTRADNNKDRDRKGRSRRGPNGRFQNANVRAAERVR